MTREPNDSTALTDSTLIEAEGPDVEVSDSIAPPPGVPDDPSVPGSPDEPVSPDPESPDPVRPEPETDPLHSEALPSQLPDAPGTPFEAPLLDDLDPDGSLHPRSI